MGSTRFRVLARRVVAAVVVASTGFSAPAADDASPAPAPKVDPAALRRQLRSIVDAGDFAAVLRAADETLRTDRESTVGWEFRAFALHKLSRVAEARDAYSALVHRARDHAWGWTQLGALELDLGRPDAARAALEKAVALAPSSEDAWRKLIRVLRAQADFAAALRSVDAAAAAKVDAKWCALEGASIAWVAGETDEASRRLDAAAAGGADAAAVANVRRLVAVDASLGDADRCRCRDGQPWQIPAGPFVVETRVAPRLPAAIEKTLANAAAAYPGFLGVTVPKGVAMKLVLARTTEEHETLRRLWMPGAAAGSAFTVDTVDMRRGGQRLQSVTMHAAWPQPGVERSVAHEAAHAFLRVRAPGIPPWLDEAVATYLEGVGLGEAPGVAHEALVKSLVDARAAGRLIAWETLPMLGAPSFQGDGARLRYAQSWLLVHWILHAEGAPGHAGFLRILDGAGGWTLAKESLTRVVARPWADVATALDAHLDRLAKPPK